MLETALEVFTIGIVAFTSLLIGGLVVYVVAGLPKRPSRLRLSLAIFAGVVSTVGIFLTNYSDTIQLTAS